MLKLFYKKINLVFAVLLCYGFSYSQNYNSKNYTSANELPNNSIRALYLDHQNFLWIGTENGVVYKENKSFTSYFEEDGLAMNNCWAIAEDPNNKMWFGSYGGGLSILNKEKFKVLSEKNGLVHNEITKLFSYNDKMYVGTSNGVSVIDINTYEISSYNPVENKLFRVSSFFENKQQIYCTTYNSGVYKINLENDEIELDKINKHKYIYAALKVNDSIFSSNKEFFSKSKLDSFISEADTIQMSKLGISVIWDYSVVSEKRVFAAAWGIYKNNGGVYEINNQIYKNRNKEFNVTSKEILSVAYDSKFNKLFVGSKDQGLFEVDLMETIQFYPSEKEYTIGFANTSESKATLFNNGILINNKNIPRSSFKNWQNNYVRTPKKALPKHKDFFYELDYNTAAADIKFYDIKTAGNLYWINTTVGMFGLKENGDLFMYLPLHTEEFNFTKNGNLIETNPYEGLRVYNSLENFDYTYFGTEHKATPTMVVNSLKKGNKTYLLSIFSGLYAWQNNKFVSYVNDSIWSEKKLNHICSLGDNLAISNEFGDVFIINDQDDFELLTKIIRSDIQGNSISFLESFNDYLLIGTEKGLTIYKDNQFIFLNEEQGLKQPFLSSKIEKNKLFIGSKNGYFSVNLEVILNSKKVVDKINLKTIKINNQSKSIHDLVKNNKITLPYDQNTIDLRFSTNAHPFPNKLEYQYRLNPNLDWSEKLTTSEIYLPYLPADKYDVEVKVNDLNNGSGYSEILLKINILPPFWKTWWFVLLSILIALVVLFIVYKFRINQLQKFENEKSLIKKRVEEVKMEALLAQMNPHFIFNAMNSIQKYIIDSDIDNAMLFLGEFSKLIRKNLDHCTRPYIFLIEEIEYLNSYIFVENKRFNSKVAIDLIVDKSINSYSVEIPSMIIQPFIENVFVHAFPPKIKKPELLISFEMKSTDTLICTIKDNGVGISDTLKKLHKSKGILLIKERLKLLGYDLNKTLSVFSSKNKGTTVVISLKV